MIEVKFFLNTQALVSVVLGHGLFSVTAGEEASAGSLSSPSNP
jgi:hypothetical protein